MAMRFEAIALMHLLAHFIILTHYKYLVTLQVIVALFDAPIH